MKKLVLIILMFIVIGFGAFLLIGKAPENIDRANISETEDISTEDQEISNDVLSDYDLSKLEFVFTGYGPGKSHDGTFNEISVSNLQINDGDFKKGKINFKTASVNTGISKLDIDLCKENFFDCQNHPEINFELTEARRQNNTINVVGILTMKDISKEISFEANQENSSLKADFILDVNQFGFSAPNIVDNEVRIRFNTTTI